VLSTRTIEGKLTCGLVLLSVLLILFGVTSALSWKAHARMIQNLETSINDAPHREDLIAALSTLVAPLVVSVPEWDDTAKLTAWAKLQQQEYMGRQESVEDWVRAYRDRLIKCGGLTAGSTGQNREMAILFQGVDEGFEHLRSAAPDLAKPDKRSAQTQWMLKITADLIDQATQMPDPSAHLRLLLEEAQADHRRSARFSLGFGIAALGVVILLALGGYFWIHRPLQSLQADFDRVAKGDYSHRATVATRDEIHALATAFNKITTKFQDVERNQNEQIQMQAQKLLQSERVVGVGFLATGVAHEINSPLGVIAICADSIARQFTVPLENWKPSDYAEGREYSQMICHETDRCKNITHRMLDFAHSSSGEKNFYDVTAIVREVVELVGHLGKYNDRKIVFETHHPCEAWVCGQEIRQVVLNLVANALQAMTPGGILRISLDETADEVDLAFHDDGCGMTPETHQKLFEPFFTTKDVGQGTGLGLSLTRKIVESHAGSISASSPGLGLGSTFRVRLPRGSNASVRAA
jgi:two-component system, NtrC family, sensor kinase